ncbi:MAG TPA: bifunctional diaminohydroxyphosphoribosylaminopyrimidine deaminase/5-amino-6-(5-phosphoribosylamino)uracil reductase RibD [Kofleriaceae bacterium]|nr:bifunctional diaminohydroxyphosphoribosylaminopyrimidine deaminase/5-amino-6-(5-phosphoribosylamino)uracil reductase RibD [Kofleriaceae bacterium]
MRRCLALARRAEGRTAPNPMVGCVVLDRRGRLVAEGWHRKAGAPHGEADALAKVGRVPGGTVYINLEPCRHHGRTPPCAPLVAESGAARVVVGMLDPIAGHGGGAAWLARRGIAVERGVLEDECRELNRAWITWARERRPWFTLKAAATLDGKVATWRGESKWVTGEAARRAGHQLRDTHDAVMVGVGTVLADDPRLTVRGVRGGRDPVRVVVDGSLRTPPGAAIVGPGRTIIATTRSAAATREGRLAAAGSEVWRLPGRGRVDLAALAARLAGAGITSVLVEGGPTLHGALLDAGLVDEVRLFLAPILLGGAGKRSGLTWIAGAGVDRLADAARFTQVAPPRRLGPDLLLTLRPR